MHFPIVRILATCAMTLNLSPYWPGTHRPVDFRQARPDSSKERAKTMQLSSYILFDGNCRQAMEHYRNILGGELTLTTVGDSPMKAAFPASMHHKVINARLKSNFVDISASDWLRPSESPVKGNTLCLYISGGGADETRELFQKLAAGALVTDPLTEQPFGLYGALNDRFGVRWMFHAER
jgi:PhnB protein